MKKLPSVKAAMAITTILLVNICTVKTLDGTKSVNNSESIVPNKYVFANKISNKELLSSNANEILAINEYTNTSKENEVEKTVSEPVIVYDGMTMDELAAKLNKNLKSTLKGYGIVFAKSSIKYGVDPYLAVAIVLHETGCASGTCSSLVKQCNNVGGMKGSKSTCGNSSYAKFKSLNSGIDAFFKNLSNNYYKKGLKTPETIGKKYAESSTWATRIRYYMNKIKNS